MTQKISIVMILLAVAAMPFQAFAAPAVKGKVSKTKQTQKVLPAAAPAVETPAAASIRPTIGGEKKMNVGLVTGLGVGSITQFNIGADFGYRLTPDWGTGAYFTFSTGSNYNLLILAGEANYFLKGQFEGLHVGGKLGFARSSWGSAETEAAINLANAWSNTLYGTDATDVDTSSFGLVIGGGAGYDYPITKDITVGGEANLLILTSSGSSAMFNLMGSVKYWF